MPWAEAEIPGELVEQALARAAGERGRPRARPAGRPGTERATCRAEDLVMMPRIRAATTASSSAAAGSLPSSTHALVGMSAGGDAARSRSPVSEEETTPRSTWRSRTCRRRCCRRWTTSSRAKVSEFDSLDELRGRRRADVCSKQLEDETRKASSGRRAVDSARLGDEGRRGRPTRRGAHARVAERARSQRRASRCLVRRVPRDERAARPSS